MNDVGLVNEVANVLLFLIVDDDELSRELLPLLLEAEGWQSEVAASGDEALSWLRSTGVQPDVVLTDMQMLGISGSALAAELAAVLPSSTKIFAMSGSQPPASSLAGYHGFIQKPFTVQDLRNALDGPGTIDLQASGSSSDFATVAMSDGHPPINEQIYKKMCEIMPESQLRELYAMSIADARKRIGMMATLAQARDDKQYRLEAHTIKGSAGFVGATELFKLAEAAERGGLDVYAQQKSSAKIDAEAGTNGVTATLDQFSLACDRLERILMEPL